MKSLTLTVKRENDTDNGSQLYDRAGFRGYFIINLYEPRQREPYLQN